MKGRNLAGFICLFIAAGVLAAIYLAGGRVTRDELYLVLSCVVAALVLFDPDDMKQILLAALQRVGSRTPPTPPSPPAGS